nr:hypothetical protein [Tanacetum cinerariifolium]
MWFSYYTGIEPTTLAINRTVERVKRLWINSDRLLLEEISKEEDDAIMADLNSIGEYNLFVRTLQKEFIIKPQMLLPKEKEPASKRASKYLSGPMICSIEYFVIKNVDFKTITQYIIDSLQQASIRCNIVTKDILSRQGMSSMSSGGGHRVFRG